MAMLVLALLLLAAVLVSSVIDQLVPKVSSPLIQIGLGLVIALFAPSQIRIGLDPDLFLVLFIAPLLYDEAKSVDKAALWRNRRPVLSLAIGLVVVTALVLGFAVHAVIPSITLASAFALGAALGPTDAVAVASLSKETNIPERQKSILEGESLINDASGIVSFQFALAAAVTGSFSLLDASVDFVVSFFGGILLGVVLGYVGNFLVRRVRLHRVGEHDVPRALRGVHALHHLPGGQRLRRERHHRRGGGRPGERHLAACHRAVHLAHEHRLVQRLARAFLRPQRRRVRAVGHAAAQRHAPHLGRPDHRQLRARGLHPGAHVPAASHPLPVGARHGARAQPHGRRPASAEQGRPEVGPRHGAGRAERHHHAGRAVHHTRAGGHQPGHLLSPARPHHLPGMRRHRGHLADRHVRGTAPGAQARAREGRGPAGRDDVQHRDPAQRRGGADRPPDARNAARHAHGRPFLQRAHRAHQGDPRPGGRAERGPAPAGPAVGARLRRSSSSSGKRSTTSWAISTKAGSPTSRSCSSTTRAAGRPRTPTCGCARFCARCSMASCAGCRACPCPNAPRPCATCR